MMAVAATSPTTAASKSKSSIKKGSASANRPNNRTEYSEYSPQLNSQSRKGASVKKKLGGRAVEQISAKSLQREMQQSHAISEGLMMNNSQYQQQ